MVQEEEAAVVPPVLFAEMAVPAVPGLSLTRRMAQAAAAVPAVVHTMAGRVLLMEWAETVVNMAAGAAAADGLQVHFYQAAMGETGSLLLLMPPIALFLLWKRNNNRMLLRSGILLLLGCQFFQ
jgi:hypothetical protein